MKWYYILAIVHVFMCTIAFFLCKKAKENEMVLFLALCFIPVIGPVIVYFSYFVWKARKQLMEQDKENTIV